MTNETTPTTIVQIGHERYLVNNLEDAAIVMRVFASATKLDTAFSERTMKTYRYINEEPITLEVTHIQCQPEHELLSYEQHLKEKQYRQDNTANSAKDSTQEADND